MSIPMVMTVAGSDSGGGAGIQADLKTFTALSVFGTSVIVALTAQNSYEVADILPVNTKFIKSQFDAVLSDMKISAAKTGMLFSREIIETVTEKFREYSIQNIVVDPVMVSKSNARLLREDAIDSLLRKLLPISYIVTPNVPEAEILSGMKITNEEDAERSAARIYDETGSMALVKGGHLQGEPVDIFYDGSHFYKFRGIRINTKNTHGTGDTLSSAIISYVSRGFSTIDAIDMAKKYVEGAIKGSFSTGKGYGSLCHSWQFSQC
ncbi:MAG: bifunctional hydroxymethylpyrimidine kinase/phosphomethylpyrimidine kinase [Thermoplasmata archaeon]